MKVALRTNFDGYEPEVTPVGDMSPAMQRVYEQTVQRFSAGDTLGSNPAQRIVPKLSARITINGREFDGTAEMPPEFRRFYEETLARAVPLQRAIRMVAETERANFIKRTVTLSAIAVGLVAAIIYLAWHGYYR